ncbi:transmembrane protein, putative (macronuclear) [Tetrahymena thermophila SB210]|uniref:Transmembrane protein, putative n=1 Tax=Tetrahymena thermophila (strain SB210) TaxID=312017 RepID=W7XIN0_TETTS|nr:transmembrane protein, putative [Tetrahymena thermophila SB210]EWS74776.1 transmembrane protein, putative [Tetrahymena thermophila SB210]|eukprot:XP_012652669.1 transmembrane protein, putative [Tetrahymena thermophila SB210]
MKYYKYFLKFKYILYQYIFLIIDFFFWQNLISQHYFGSSIYFSRNQLNSSCYFLFITLLLSSHSQLISVKQYQNKGFKFDFSTKFLAFIFHLFPQFFRLNLINLHS